jgi:hypothetical protein
MAEPGEPVGKGEHNAAKPKQIQTILVPVAYNWPLYPFVMHLSKRLGLYNNFYGLHERDRHQGAQVAIWPPT